MHKHLLLLAALSFLLPNKTVRGEIPYTLSYSTYLGGSNWEHARDIYTDAAGFTYVVGGTGSGDFAGTGSFPGANTYNAGQPNSAGDGAFGGCDVFITKMSPTGQVLWTKYMGGANYDRAYALEVDGSGNIYIAGRAGRGFPMVNAMQATFSGTSSPSSYGDQNGFVAKLDSAGTVLWSTYVGTGELCRDIAIDAAGDVYVPLTLAATSSRTAFGTPALGAFSGKFTNAPPTTNTTDVGLVKLKGDGSGVAWARWIGGTGAERTNPSIRVNAAGEAHLLFSTTSTNTSLPAVGSASQTDNGAFDLTANGSNDGGFLVLSADFTQLEYATLFGGSLYDNARTLFLAGDGSVYLTGGTLSSNFPTRNADDPSFNGGSHPFAPGSGDAWVARFSVVP